MGAMAVAIGYALKAQPLRCFPLCRWVLRPISWAARRLPSLVRRFPSPFSPLPVSGRVTSGNCQHAFQASLCHFPILPYISSLVNL